MKKKMMNMTTLTKELSVTNHIDLAQQTLLSYLKEHQSPSLLLTELKLHQAYVCNARAFYLFELHYVNANGPQMAIVSVDALNKAQVMSNLGMLNTNIAQIVIKSFIKNNPLEANAPELKLESPELFTKLEDTFSAEDQYNIAEFMSSHSVTAFVFFKEPNLNLEQVVATYHKLWGVEVSTLPQFNMQQGQNEGFITYHDTNIYLTKIEESMPDELLKGAASLSSDWPNAYEMAKQGSNIFQITLDNQSLRAHKATELVRWLCALMVANSDKVTALMYNFYLFNPQSYLNNAHELQEHPDKAPLANLLYFTCAPAENNALQITTVGMENLERLEMAYLRQQDDSLSPQEAILVLKLLGEHLLKNNEYLQDNTTFSLNADLNMQCNLRQNEQQHKYCLITRKS